MLMPDALLNLKVRDAISAYHVCNIAYWVEKAGVSGKALTTMAFAPGKCGGAYQKHLDAVRIYGSAKHT